jgi:hypothetical protein
MGDNFMEKCLNCGIDLAGDYCHICGQKRYERKDRTVGTFIRNFIEESFSFDSKFFRSLKLLVFKPGFLTNEYFSGRVSSYITPLKMYLFVSVVSFFIISLISPDDLSSLSENFDAKEFVNNYISSKGVSYEVFEIKFNSELQNKMPLYFLALVILFSLPLKVIYLHTKRLYVEHLVFSIHFFSFLLLMIIFSNLLELILTDIAYLFFFILPFIYLIIAVKQVYKQNFILSFFETAILFLYYIGLLIIWILAVFLITLLTI